MPGDVKGVKTDLPITLGCSTKLKGYGLMGRPGYEAMVLWGGLGTRLWSYGEAWVRGYGLMGRPGYEAIL